jgi:hypothetical protein
VAPNARDRTWLRLPRGLGWLRWPLRPLRLLVAFGRLPLRDDRRATGTAKSRD